MDLAGEICQFPQPDYRKLQHHKLHRDRGEPGDRDRRHLHCDLHQHCVPAQADRDPESDRDRPLDHHQVIPLPGAVYFCHRHADGGSLSPDHPPAARGEPDRVSGRAGRTGGGSPADPPFDGEPLCSLPDRGVRSCMDHDKRRHSFRNTGLT